MRVRARPFVVANRAVLLPDKCPLDPGVYVAFRANAHTVLAADNVAFVLLANVTFVCLAHDAENFFKRAHDPFLADRLVSGVRGLKNNIDIDVVTSGVRISAGTHTQTYHSSVRHHSSSIDAPRRLEAFE